MKYALLIVDVLNDFVTGPLKCERGVAIVPHVIDLCDAARKANIPLLFCNDSHLKNDHELSIWGEHAMTGSEGAKVIPQLKLDEKHDYVIQKHCYSSFYNTKLDALLKEKQIDTVIICGLQAHICVFFTAIDACQYGYNVIVAKEAIDSFAKEDYEIAMRYMKQSAGAKLLTNAEIKKLLNIN